MNEKEGKETKKGKKKYLQVFAPATLFTSGRLFAPVLKVSKAATRDGRSYLEIMSIEANDWRPRGAVPEP